MAPPTAPVAASITPAPYPWLFIDWGTALVVVDHVDDSWLAGPPKRDTETFGYRVDRPLRPESLPKALTDLIGTELRVADAEQADCAIRVTGFTATAWLDPESDDFDFSAHGDDALDAALWEAGRKIVTAQWTPTREDSCNRPVFAAPAAYFPLVLARSPSPKATLDAARRAVRAHAIWAFQEEAYHRSLTLARRHKRLLSENGYTIDLPRRIPAHWDETPPRQDWGEFQAFDLRDASGAIRLHLVFAGNGISCASPEVWFLFEPGFARTVAYGIDSAPEVITDLDGDGAFELTRSRFPAQWIERTDQRDGDGAVVVRQTSPPPDRPNLQCAWEQVPPLEVIEGLLAPKPAAPALPAP